jgi:uncharacterized protein (TIGR03067 family)
MRPRTLSVLLVVFLLGADAKDDAVKKDLDKMQGTWNIVSLVADGKEAPARELKIISLTIKGDQSTFVNGDKMSKGTYKLDPSKQPKALDIVLTEGSAKGKTLFAIYDFEGEQLRICYHLKERPTAFESKTGSANTLQVWKRAKE